MQKYSFLLVLLLVCQELCAQRIVFWNLENFFGYRNDSTAVPGWTKRRFETKCNAVAKSILWIAGEEGGLPDAVGLEEVENAFVLRRLLQSTALSKTDYRYIHFDSPDKRGIDAALLYRSSTLEFIDAKPCHILERDSSVISTRDILLARFRDTLGRDLAILVNHHPSKYGGASSAGKRQLALERMYAVMDSLKACGATRIVSGGDFNDSPAPAPDGWINLAEELHRKGRGTIRFQGRWEMIDHVIVSDNLEGSRMKIIQIPFLMADDRTYGGKKPLRTFTGPRYSGGVSDHCPILVNIAEN